MYDSIRGHFDHPNDDWEEATKRLEYLFCIKFNEKHFGLFLFLASWIVIEICEKTDVCGA